jgi:hypothetical protein
LISLTPVADPCSFTRRPRSLVEEEAEAVHRVPLNLAGGFHVCRFLSEGIKAPRFARRYGVSGSKSPGELAKRRARTVRFTGLQSRLSPGIPSQLVQLLDSVLRRLVSTLLGKLATAG